MDWGSAAPFSVGWWSVVGERRGDLERGCLVRYREWYGAGPTGHGLKLSNDEIAAGIRERSGNETYAYSVLDPSAFQAHGGPTIAEQFYRNGVQFRMADNKRVSQRGAMGGWDQMRNRLKAGMIACFSTCKDSIRTIPVLQHDQARTEDLDTDAEDHAADEWRYACMSRPWAPKIKEKIEGRGFKVLSEMTYDEAFPLKPKERRDRI